MLLIFVGALIYITVYFTYGKYLRDRMVKNSDVDVPSKRLYDGVDFIPANKYVLFGHHFASIAGAAPIVGPAIAIAWGWLPAILWIWFGNIIIGAVHDYLSLMSSVRYDGHSVQWIAGKVIRKRTGRIFSWFVFLVLILLIASFGAIIGQLHVKQPEVPTVYILTIMIALFFGYLLYKVKINFKIATLIGLLLLVLAIYAGQLFPIAASYKVWMVVLFVYIIVASSLPVNVLLQPRDYLNAWLLAVCLLLGAVALVFSFKTINVPAVTVFSAPVILSVPTPFWPVIPLIIACGSLSGFHALVASGTTSKQLQTEEDGLFIGYGGMLTEGFLATLVVAAIGSFGMAKIPSELTGKLLESDVSFANNYLAAAAELGGPVGIFSHSYAGAVNAAFGFSYEFIVVLASLWVASFSLTTLDTTNRLGRYAVAEIFDPFKQKNPKFYHFITNRWIASTIPAFLGISLAWSGAWSILWPAFGGANQMLASVALITVSAWVIREQKTSGLYVFIPALFLWVTVTAAIIWYLIYAIPVFFTASPFQSIILSFIMIAMLVLNIVLIYDYFISGRDIKAKFSMDRG